MQLFRFDEEVSIPIPDFGSRFRIGPLTGDDARVRLQVIYLPAGGQIGRHVTPVCQLLAVMTGDGWATGHEGERRDLRRSYAALWEAGEIDGVGSAGA